MWSSFLLMWPSFDRDKAGAYGYQQGLATFFVERIEGCYYNVVGLPTTNLLKQVIQFVQGDSSLY